MRHIVQGNAPTSFQNWKRANSSGAWGDFSDPASSGYTIYCELRETLIGQQDKMCCYCEVALKHSEHAHIEHLRDRHNNPKETFNFHNLLASCKYNDCCGQKKDRYYFNEMVSPLDDDCQSRFTYTGNGKLIPSDEADTFAQRTIDLLGLNCKRLKDRRLSLIRELDNEYTDFEKSLFNYIEWHQGFYTVIQYVANKNGVKL